MALASMAEELLTATEWRRLMESPLGLDGEDVACVFPRAAAEAEAILGQAVAICVRRSGRWNVVAQSSDAPAIARDAEDQDDFSRVACGSPPDGPALWLSADGSAWTLIALSPSPPSVVAIRGDWTSSSPRLALWAKALSAARRAALRAASERRHVAAHRLASRLGRATSSQEVCGLALRSMARAVHARLGALALPDPLDQHLSVVATYGYPLDLVKHLRIAPGEGVIGSVFASGHLLNGRTASESSGRKPRPRYQSDSFIAVPIRAGRAVVGVVCVTDRTDGRPFSRRDASMLRGLAAPVALAIGRESALVQMREFAHGAAIDPVSGSFNRRHFQIRLEEELQRTKRDGLTLALLMIDIDDFKVVNDSFGHLAGDMVIKDVAEILRRSVRVFDVCARFGGEEFAVLMPASSIESAAKVAGRIRERIQFYRRAEAGLEALKVTASVGLAVSVPEITASELIARSDEALYRAKRSGKNRVRVFSAKPENVRRAV